MNTQCLLLVYYIVYLNYFMAPGTVFLKHEIVSVCENGIF